MADIRRCVYDARMNLKANGSSGALGVFSQHLRHHAGGAGIPSRLVCTALAINSTKGFRHFNQIDADPCIVLIDISDYALRSIHRWPWPRRMQADLVGILDECGAETILLDIVYAEPSPGRISDPRLEPDYDTDAAGDEVLGETSIANAIYDDRGVGHRDSKCGQRLRRVARAIHHAFDPQQLRDDARKLLDENPAITRQEFAATLNLPADDDSQTRFVQARIDRYCMAAI
ncbi:MAG: CHASE2 domain-containing protein [Phycisphaerae bacterium]